MIRAGREPERVGFQGKSLVERRVDRTYNKAYPLPYKPDGVHFVVLAAAVIFSFFAQRRQGTIAFKGERMQGRILDGFQDIDRIVQDIFLHQLPGTYQRGVPYAQRFFFLTATPPYYQYQEDDCLFHTKPSRISDYLPLGNFTAK